jgi:hypothetical protein
MNFGDRTSNASLKPMPTTPSLKLAVKVVSLSISK